MDGNLDALFNPENIAVVGASSNKSKAGHVILQNLINIGYPKKIFPISIKEDEILGIKCHKRISEVDDTLEMVILITPSGMIFDVMKDIETRMRSRNDIKIIICAAAGYAETRTPEGIERQSCLMEVSKKYGIRVVGPNCIGVIDNINRVDTTFVETLLSIECRGKKGGISFISQSGSVATSILMNGASQPAPISFNKFVSIGNMADIDFIDLLEYFEEDPDTRVIGLYLEGYPQGRKLINTMARITKKKPIVVLKAGRSEKGAFAANSHTGSLAGSDAVYDGAFRQYGVVRVQNMQELMDTLQAFDKLILPRDNNVFVLSQAGGFGIHGADLISADENLVMPKVMDHTKERLKGIVPPMSSICRPEGYADITASATVEQHVEALRAVMDDPNVGSVLYITVVPTFLPRRELGEGIVKLLKEEGYSKKKPVYPVILAGNYVRECREIIESSGIYTFATVDQAVSALSCMVMYSNYLKRLKRRDGK